MSHTLDHKPTRGGGSLITLTRHQNYIFKHLERLNSYTCEPNDYSCFIRIGQLKDGFAKLALEQKALLQSCRNKKELNAEDTRKIADCDRRYQQLEVELAAYLSQVKSHR